MASDLGFRVHGIRFWSLTLPPGMLYLLLTPQT